MPLLFSFPDLRVLPCHCVVGPPMLRTGSRRCLQQAEQLALQFGNWSCKFYHGEIESVQLFPSCLLPACAGLFATAAGGLLIFNLLKIGALGAALWLGAKFAESVFQGGEQSSSGGSSSRGSGASRAGRRCAVRPSMTVGLGGFRLGTLVGG